LTLNGLGSLFFEMGDYKTAEIYYKKALETRKKFLGEDHIEFANSLNDLGILYSDMGNYKAAESYYKQTMEIRKNALGEEHPDYAETLNNLGTLYNEIGNYKAAEPYYKQALEIKRKALGEEHPDYAMTLNNLGSLYHEMLDYEAAIFYYNKAVKIFKQTLGEEHPDYATTLNNLGALYHEMGDYKAAEPYYLETIDIRKKILGEEHPDFARILENLGNLYFDMGDYKSAEPYYKRATYIFKNSLGEEHIDFAASINNLGVLYSDMGDYKEAETYYKQALKIKKNALGEEHPDYAMTFNNIGSLYDKLGDYQAAETYYKQSMKICKKVLGEEHRDYAMTLNNLGSLYLDMGNFKAAETYYKQALEIKKKVLGDEHPDYAMTLNNLGNLYLDMDDYKSAKKFYKNALKIRTKVLSKEHPDFASSLNSLGVMYKLLRDYKASESYFKQSIEITKIIFGEEHSLYSSGLKNLGNLYVEKGDINSAEQIYKKAVNVKLGNIIRNFSWLSTKDKRAYWQQEIDFFQYLSGFSNLATNSVSKTTELSYNINIISKSLLLETSREVDQAISNSSDQLLKSQYTEMNQLRRMVSKMQSEGSDKKEIIDRYNSDADSLDKILVNKMGEYANAKRKFEITWKDIQNNLSASEAAIEFARFYDYKDSAYKYMALVVKPGYEYPKLVKLGSELNIKNASSQREFSDLYKFVWVGFDSLLTGVKTIYYSPVGELNNVSFSALMSETNNQLDSTKSSWSYLMDRYDLHQVTTTRYLADGTLKRNDSLPLSIKLIGGVNYSDFPLVRDSIAIYENTEDLALQINLQNEMIDSKSNRGGKINYLKGSEIEVKEIANTLKNSGWETTISDGKSASEYQFKQELNVKSPGVIHISTHGFAFPEKEIKDPTEFLIEEKMSYKISEDPMVRCGLMLSGANLSWNGDSKKMIETTGDDGILTAAEVANMDLSNTKLVVLSACETGLGKIESSEGTFGLKRGFKLAGVDQIIVSLWKVPDNETMELMTLFYSELAKSNNIDSSFSKAQKVMRNRYPFEPQKWAGFVLVR
jgi:tetratricopeptide (TPR) repeat protein/CHAT domain-containing protein